MTSEILQIFERPSGLESCFLNLVDGKKLIIYGYGSGYQSLVQSVLGRSNLSPSIFIDKKFSIPNIDGRKYHPEEFFEKFSIESKDDFIILVTIGDRGIYNQVSDSLRSYGFTNIHSILDLYEINLCYADYELANNLKSTYLSDLDDISRAYHLLSDEKSKEIFLKIIDGHFHKKPINFTEYSYESQYIADGLGLREKEIRLLNCGAYDGDTLDKFISKYKNLSLAVALECDFGNFLKLSGKQFLGIEKLVLLPIGSGNKNMRVEFAGGGEMLSRITAEGLGDADKIAIVSCDQVFKGLNFNKIVIDTEGHEHQSLNGMRGIIEESKPDICIAAYHYPTDIYSIINLLHTFNENYNFFLRNHSPFVIDTVLYAVDK
ncbi:hypothetical protein DPM18_01795 [Polynucleobacter paneuropaeus]|uniref:hypothetical protein n=1 Tax=Polynucleobacter paneuropaeus TaxID=2527775 RepID=UPI000DBEF66D|nr:hypothetical protein [Polynucleobacter paneuropaeus]AWW45655.1 hypothetical protein DPM18_01795 [Polynucleobacter paneuropaeus]